MKLQMLAEALAPYAEMGFGFGEHIQVKKRRFQAGKK
jgi:hypothetical protein